MRRAKIVCTLGPAVASQEGIQSLVDAGMDVARMNLSHGSYSDHERVYQWVRAAGDAAGRGVGILVDLQGPKIRLGTFANGPVVLDPGARFTITIEDVPGDVEIASTTYKGLPGDVNPGDMILIDDGKVALQAIEVSETEVVTEVVEGGRVSDNKGINLPGVAVSVPALSEKDVADLRWALRLGVDLIALSFVRSADDLLDVQRIMDDEGVRLPVLAKIEKPQAVANLEAIVDAFDGIMVARGDLGVELPLEQVPLVQKRAIQLARRRAKPVIVATQMLDSMISMTRPTRAEASDVANAVLDGTDALMLSGETSVGAHPAHVVRTMSRIIEQVEAEALDRLPKVEDPNDSTSRSITRAAVNVANDVHASGVIAFTETGRSARLVSRYRPAMPLMAFTPNPRVRSQLALSWGVETYLVPKAASTDDMVRLVDAALLDHGRAQVGELLVIIAGVPPGVPGTTNGMRVHRMGAVIPSGI
ncbi:MAG: pyruvate kinase [Actinobacteria bacterium]|nr:pyruvate kinase [Actinomycetota bacterium]